MLIEDPSQLLLVSPRNTISDHISLLDSTSCGTLLTPPGPPSPIVTGIVKQRPLQVLNSPGLTDLLANTYTHYPFKKMFNDARNEPLVVVHTSGTTAVPKPIIFSHDFASSYIQMGQLEPPPGFEMQVTLCQSNRFFVTLPFFHVGYLSSSNKRKADIVCTLYLINNTVQAGNLFATLFDAIANQTTVITPLAGVMPSAQTVFEGLKHMKADALFLAPPFLEQIAKSPEVTEYIARNVKTVVYGGGDVSQWSGDTIASQVQLFNFNGSTETGSIPILRPSDHFPSKEWKYIQPHPAGGVEFRTSPHGQFEAFIVKNPVFENEQPVFKLFPQLQEFSTKDLWAPHPSKEGLWTYRGRADDTILFKAGFMCDPVPLEQHVSQHPEVQAALMAGTGRSQPTLIIERVDDKPLSPTREQELTDDIWRIVQEANQTYKTGARIAKSHILYTTPQHPMRRAGKGTVQRGPTLELYKDALDALYEREGDAVPGNELVLPGFTSDAS